nr:HAD family hydrolase [Lachnospiraceae bacterium]
MKQYIPNIKLVSVDMDGTLLKSDKTIHQDTLRDIEEASRKGINVTYCTGRAIPELAAYVNSLPAIRYGVCLAGALVYDFHEKRVIYKRSLHPGHVRKIVESSLKYDAMAQFLTVDKSIVRSDQVNHMDDFNLGEYQAMFDEVTTKVDDLSEEVKDQEVILKANIHYHTAEDRQAAYEDLKLLPMSFVLSETSTLEIMPEGVNKAA